MNDKKTWQDYIPEYPVFGYGYCIPYDMWKEVPEEIKERYIGSTMGHSWYLSKKDPIDY